MTILFDAPKQRQKAWRNFFDLCQRIEEPITEELMHGASAMEEDEFAQLNLGVFMPATRNRDGKRNSRFKTGFRIGYPTFLLRLYG